MLYINKNIIEDKSVRRHDVTQHYAELLIPVSTLPVQFQGQTVPKIQGPPLLYLLLNTLLHKVLLVLVLNKR